jgi:septal ring factor EnvC (AmiA/AmiB activator)
VGWTTIDGAVVVAPIAGKALYLGPVHGLGDAVLLDIGRGITLLITGIGTLDAGLTQGAMVPAGMRLGIATAGEVRLELRRDGRTIDPTPFLLIPR